MQTTLRRTQHATSRKGQRSRREFVAGAVRLAAGAALFNPAVGRSQPADDTHRKMTICFTPGSIGVSANQTEAITLAERHGFEAVEPFASQLPSLTNQQLGDVVASLKAKGLVWGAAGLPVDFRQDEARFNEGLKALSRTAATLAKAGANRVGTWVSPTHNSLTYLQNFRQHAQRLRETARVLKDHGLRLGLEYVGTLTSRNRQKYVFVHTLAEMKELIAEIGTGNVGLVLDSWHWWQAGDSADDLLTLTNDDIVSVDLNDAPAGVPKEQQKDNERELPCATGVIDVAAFLRALAQVGYNGPVRAEPFNKALNDLDNEAASAATITAMHKAFGLIR
jgi:sugar phosphate isomerase/epimerase